MTVIETKSTQWWRRWVGIDWIYLSFVEPAGLYFGNENLSQRKIQSQSSRYHLLAHRCQKSFECQEKKSCQRKNRRLRPDTNLSIGQEKVGTDLKSSFWSWCYERPTYNLGGLFITQSPSFWYLQTISLSFASSSLSETLVTEQRQDTE